MLQQWKAILPPSNAHVSMTELHTMAVLELKTV
jgi:hypothetical protein